MPRVSIVLPTYNRADTLTRAIASVRAQRMTDWELLVVDDGSTDRTPDLLAAIDEPRLRTLRQANAGVGAARNAGLDAARGGLIAFLDSDDEWPPHHLALATAFFDAFRDAHLYTSEFWELFEPGRHFRHFVVEMTEWYPETGRRIGSATFAGDPPGDDPLLRFFDHVEPVGAWADQALGAEWTHVRHYRGALFERWRWGWLGALQPTVITRRALDAVGRFDTSYGVANDFGFLAELSRRFTTHFFTVPGCYKHEYGPDGKPIAEGHLVSGTTSVRFHADVLRYLESLYLSRAPNDPELLALRGFRHSLIGRAALLRGDRESAVCHLSEAVRTYPGGDVRALLWLARLGPTDAVTARVYREWARVVAVPRRIRRAIDRSLRSGG